MLQFVPKEKLKLLFNRQCRVLWHPINSWLCIRIFLRLFGDEHFNSTDALHMTYYMVDISSSLPESHASRPHSELWSVMFFISHDFNPHDSNFRTVAFLAEWFVIFLFLHNSKLFIWLNIVFIVLKPIRWILIQMVVYCYKAQKSPLDHFVKSVQIRSYFWSVFGHFSSSGHCCDFFCIVF